MGYADPALFAGATGQLQKTERESPCDSAGGVFRIHLTNLSYHSPLEAGPDAKLKQPRFLGQHPPGFFVLIGIPDNCFARCEYRQFPNCPI
jgi:hypothetical protein